MPSTDDMTTPFDTEDERRRVHRSVRTTFAIARLKAASVALIELRELTEPGEHAVWIDKQIGACILACEVLGARLRPL